MHELLLLELLILHKVGRNLETGIHCWFNFTYMHTEA
uniref:Uncharacterized protein n=1 Tax=Rhizophora mucronata TaxID=61149 RepID=A0A2P2IJ46_RHIMU